MAHYAWLAREKRLHSYNPKALHAAYYAPVARYYNALCIAEQRYLFLFSRLFHYAALSIAYIAQMPYHVDIALIWKGCIFTRVACYYALHPKHSCYLYRYMRPLYHRYPAEKEQVIIMLPAVSIRRRVYARIYYSAVCIKPIPYSPAREYIIHMAQVVCKKRN